MSEFIAGQRWISDAELQMGLGTVMATEHRTVTIVFLATGETRTYAKQTAPLTRVAFATGDQVRSHEGWLLKVEAVRDDGGLLTYVGTRENGARAELPEGQLDNFMQLNRPGERLFSGQVDADKWFDLRYETLRHTNRLAQSPLRGLIGGRTSPIPHQLYIAHEVANRYAPRVLLADEVGLGKTIEAGLILHHQLLTERAQRALIVVPESLLHQWLVEMRRRFNLNFSLFDEGRCLAAEESSGQDNPFQSEQLVLCALEFLLAEPQRAAQAAACDWDLLVVDEAHHLQWAPGEPSAEYSVVEHLAAHTKGVLLLTATPEQLGKAGHFARLRLLDPDRFPNFEAFVAEEQRYEPVAQAVEELLDGQVLSEGAYRTLLDTVGEGDNQALLDTARSPQADADSKAMARSALVEHLLDRHGTGRVLFRNTRAAVQGFPARTVEAYPLALPEAYAQCLAEFQTTGLSEPQLLLSPELLYQATASAEAPAWTRIDPRIGWLIAQLKALRGAKVLVITASPETAMDIAEALRLQSGIHAAVFHEGLSIIERDRAAAYFADMEYGSQVLICSEIGSEGRNFQFAHHLVLFDLPLNPDLLEQRIGRLDRIGQCETIRIHVPYLEASAQAVMFRWYHEGLEAFEHTCPAGQGVFARVRAELVDTLHQIDEGLADLEAVLGTTAALHRELNEALQRGRDRLLEYNSCRPKVAEALRQQAAVEDAESGLLDYLEAVFDCFGIDLEDHSEGSYIIRPGERMHGAGFPGLDEEGMTFTCVRPIALANEDRHFLTWEHPLVTGAMDMVLGSELGNSAVTAIKYRGAKPGSLLLECLYILDSASTEAVQSARYLPPTMVRVVVDAEGRDHAASLSHEAMRDTQQPVDADTGRKIVKAYTPALRDMLEGAERRAGQQAPALLEAAHRQSRDTLLREVDRLRALQKVNPNVREEEVAFFQGQLDGLTRALDAATLRLDAVRVIVVT